MDGHVLVDMNEAISQSFSSSHKAVDIVGAGNSISDVIAFGDGTVEIVVNTVTGNRKGSRGTASYGNFIKIRHDNGMKTLYAHLEYGSISVKAGERVSKGQKIGRMGDTGNAYGVHLHFEIRQSNDTRIDPYPYLFEGKASEFSTVDNEFFDNNSVLIDSNSNETPLGETEGEIVSKHSNSTVDKSEDDSFDIGNAVDYSDLTIDGANNLVISNPDENISYLSNSEYSHGSIVDGLKSIGADSSFDYRTLVAYENGIHNYRGSYEQNIQLLNLLKAGKLKSIR